MSLSLGVFIQNVLNVVISRAMKFMFGTESSLVTAKAHRCDTEKLKMSP